MSDLSRREDNIFPGPRGVGIAEGSPISYSTHTESRRGLVVSRSVDETGCWRVLWEGTQEITSVPESNLQLRLNRHTARLHAACWLARAYAGDFRHVEDAVWGLQDRDRNIWGLTHSGGETIFFAIDSRHASSGSTTLPALSVAVLIPNHPLADGEMYHTVAALKYALYYAVNRGLIPRDRSLPAQPASLRPQGEQYT